MRQQGRRAWVHVLVLAAKCTANFLTKTACRSGQGNVSSRPGKKSSPNGPCYRPLLEVQMPQQATETARVSKLGRNVQCYFSILLFPLSLCEQEHAHTNCGGVTVNDRGFFCLSVLFLFMRSHSQSLIPAALTCFVIYSHFPIIFVSVYTGAGVRRFRAVAMRGLAPVLSDSSSFHESLPLKVGWHLNKTEGGCK